MLKILCLHGYRQDGESFKSKLGGFRKAVKNIAHLCDPQRWAILKEHVGMSGTRWTDQVTSVRPFAAHLAEIRLMQKKLRSLNLTPKTINEVNGMNRRNQIIQARDATVEVEVSNLELLLTNLEDLRGKWPQILNEVKMVAEEIEIETHFPSKQKVKKRTRLIVIEEDDEQGENIIENPCDGSDEPESEFKWNVFFVIIDSFMTHMKYVVLTETQQRAWWFSKEQNSFCAQEVSDICKGFQTSLDAVKQEFDSEGPFDGILGFSQGAAMVTLLCALKETKAFPYQFSFVFLIAAFKSNSKPHEDLYCNTIETPSLHVIGDTDSVIPKEMSETLLNCYLNPVVVQHPGGHYIPVSGQYKTQYLQFLQCHLKSNS
ncbi:uncharacterized protein LOC106469268 [Limulus polyphemus]|uniref:Uncharacterized protein LOC106469268 n=1 Tax=Limulus polyphemus TaxID=6850 RepID=A0ABM1TC42_LIMPO|nr:uncharacterized protein LOC106469268 [Limulus polyphemus]